MHAPSSRTTVTLLLCALATAAGCGDAELERLDTQRALEAESVFGPLQPGEELDPINNGDGTISYALSPASALEPGTLVEAGIVTWRYAGQARFPAQHAPGEDIQPYQATEETGTTTQDQLDAIVRVDNRGRRWVVDHYDEQALADAIATYDAGGEEDPDLPEELPEELLVVPNPNETPPPGTWVDFEPHSWEHFDCPAEGNAPDVRTHTWEGEDRVTVSSHRFQEEAAVKIFTLRDGSNPTAQTARRGHCSGVMIDDSHVLTAAHCVSNANNYDLQTNRVQVCLDTNKACTGNFLGAAVGRPPLPPFATPVANARTVIAIDRPAGYTGASDTSGGIDYDDDWAIITLSGPFSNRAFRLSRLEGPGIRALTRTRSFGYPAQRRDGSSSGCTDTLTRLQTVTELESPTSTTSKKVRHRLDGTGGQSGAPIFYCPHRDNSRCDEHPAEIGFVYAVHAGWNGFNQRVVGPKVSSFRAAALAIIDG